jgi:microcystin-dependent protein
MANLTESATWVNDVYRIDENDPVQGWDGSTLGISNQQADALAKRTQWLKSKVDLGRRITTIESWAPLASGDLKTLTPTDLKGKLLRVDVSDYDAEALLPVASSVADGGNIQISIEPGAGHQFLNSNGKVVNLQTSPGDDMIDLESGQTINDLILNPLTILNVFKLNSTTYLVHSTHKVEDCPKGMIMAWPVNSPPYGWLECNGASISRAAYAALFANIGVVFGSASGTHFNIPDLRGQFIRGWDNGRGVDTDGFTLQATTTNGSANITNADTSGLSVGMTISGTGIPGGATITAITNASTFVISANATATGNLIVLTVAKVRLFGSFQADVLKQHAHRIATAANQSNNAAPNDSKVSDWEGSGNTLTTDNVQPIGGYETRPKNVALMYCIKY